MDITLSLTEAALDALIENPSENLMVLLDKHCIMENVSFVGNPRVPLCGILVQGEDSSRNEDMASSAHAINRRMERKRGGALPLLVMRAADDEPARERGDAPAVLVSDELRPEDAALVLSAAMHELQAWDSDLKEALVNDLALKDIAAIGQRLVRLPFSIIDKKLNVIAVSPNYEAWSQVHDAGLPRNPSDTAGSIPMAAANELIEDEGYHRAATMTDPFYYPFDDSDERYYGINLFESGDYIARMTLPLPRGVIRLSEGEEALIKHLGEHLFEHLRRHAGSMGLQRGADDSMHILARTLIEGADASAVQPEMEMALKAYGWGPDDDLIAVELDFFEGPSWESATPYLCNVLETRWRDSVALPRGGNVTWLVNTASHGSAREGFMKLLAATVTDYACQAGVSRPFSDLALLQAHHRQACAALVMGRRSHPHLWYHLFDDHAFDYLLSHMTGELAARDVAHPGVLRLLAHDELHGSEFARSLAVYLDCDCNTTHAAEALFIHRSSLLRRLERINEIACFDAASMNGDDKLHVLLTLRLLGIE